MGSAMINFNNIKLTGASNIDGIKDEYLLAVDRAIGRFCDEKNIEKPATIRVRRHDSSGVALFVGNVDGRAFGIGIKFTPNYN